MKLFTKYGYYYLTIGTGKHKVTIPFETNEARQYFILGYLKAKIEFKGEK